MLVCGIMPFYNVFDKTQGRVQFPTGGHTPRAERPNRCDSDGDSTVWMEEKFVRFIFYLEVLSDASFLFEAGEETVMNSTTNKLTKIAILGALAAVLMWIEFAIPPFPSFYKIDFSEIPVLLGAFSMGPLEGIAIEAVKIIIKLLIKPTSTMFIGELANFIVGVALVVPAAWIYQKNKTKKNAIRGLVIGTLCMAIAGALFNYLVLLPMYVNIMGLDAILGAASDISLISNLETLVIFGTFPFNLIKGIAVSVLTVLMYKHLSPLLHR